MADFTHLQSLRVADDATASFTFFQIGGEPTLQVRHAGQSNRDFFNAALKMNKAAARGARKQRGGVPTPEDIEKARQQDIRIFARYIVTDWQNVLDSEGNQVEFSEEVCVQFLQAIPSDMFTELRVFCLDITNFREEEMMDEEELEDLQGN